MATLIVYVLDCHCGGEAEHRTVDSVSPQEDGSLRIDVEFAIGQSSFTCPDCGCRLFVGDVDHSTEPEECPGRDDVDDDAGHGDES